MIYYQRSEWYGLHYLLKIEGSLLPRCMPSMIISGVISGLTAAGYMDQVFQVCGRPGRPRQRRAHLNGQFRSAWLASLNPHQLAGLRPTPPPPPAGTYGPTMDHVFQVASPRHGTRSWL